VVGRSPGDPPGGIAGILDTSLHVLVPVLDRFLDRARVGLPSAPVIRIDVWYINVHLHVDGGLAPTWSASMTTVTSNWTSACFTRPAKSSNRLISTAANTIFRKSTVSPAPVTIRYGETLF